MPKKSATMKAVHAPSRRIRSTKDYGVSSSGYSSSQNMIGSIDNSLVDKNKEKENVPKKTVMSKKAKEFFAQTDAVIEQPDDAFIVLDTDEVWEKDEDVESRISYTTSEENCEASKWKGNMNMKL
jgi:hypothetical protein